MTFKFFRPCTLALLGTALTLPSMVGNMISPGTSVTPDTFMSTAFTFVATTGPLTINPLPGTSFNATYTETVYRANTTAAGLCVGCLDFLFSVTNSGPGIFERISTANFDSFILDVGYNTTLSASGAVLPASIDRSAAGGVLGFNMLATGVTTGQTTAMLEIQTNATGYTSGTVSVQDGTSGFNNGFAPTATPEPTYMALVGGLLCAIGFIRPKKKSL